MEGEENKKINANGIGLGVAISQSLVRRLNNDSGDEIRVASEYGKGTLFQFLLRDLRINPGSASYFNEEELEEFNVLKSLKHMNFTTFRHHCYGEGEKQLNLSDKLINKIESNQCLINETKYKNILVVDDDQINILVFSTYLNTFSDCKYEIAFNGQQALDLVIERGNAEIFYDIIFMDCNMPIMDGFEATKKLKELENQNLLPQVPIIASTANASQSDYEYYFKNGMTDFISKPFGKRLLREMIDKYCKH